MLRTMTCNANAQQVEGQRREKMEGGNMCTSYSGVSGMDGKIKHVFRLVRHRRDGVGNGTDHHLLARRGKNTVA